MLVRVLRFHVKQSTRTLHCSGILQFNRQRDVEEQRAELLTKLIKTNNDKRKHWHLQIGATGSPEKSIYNKVSRPHKRAGVLNSLFMKNITDVLSTGDACPEIIGRGVEVTGVRVTSDYQIVNVFWQIPSAAETCNSDVEEILLKSAPDIRGELIRRNVLGKVPRIYFIRDPTNKRVSDFQKCLEISGVSEIKSPPSVPADELLKNIYQFTEGRGENPKKNKELKKDKVREEKISVPMPEKPPDMKLDVMGLNYEQIFNKVIAAKKRPKELPGASLPIVPCITEDESGMKTDKIDFIQADPLFGNIDREKQIKKFCLDQKNKWAKVDKCDNVESATYMSCDSVDDVTEDYEEDYFEEDEEEENNDTNDTHV